MFRKYKKSKSRLFQGGGLVIDYRLNIVDNIYYMIFLYNEKPKIVNLNTKNYILAKERAKKYIEEVQECVK